MSVEEEEEEEEEVKEKRKIESDKDDNRVTVPRIDIPILEALLCERVIRLKRQPDRRLVGQGKGSVGYVLQAIFDGYDIAIKIQHGTKADFERELYISLLASKHGFAPFVFGGKYCEEGGFGFIAMELCNPVPEELNRLSIKHLEEYRFPVIDKMHKAGIFHNDLHQANWLYKNGRFLICDFGSSKLFNKDITDTQMAAIDIKCIVASLCNVTPSDSGRMLDDRYHSGYPEHTNPKFFKEL